MDIRKQWRAFLLQKEFTREYPAAYNVSSVGITSRNPVLEAVLPTLLHIKMTAILDEALAEHIATSGMKPAKRYRSDLSGRITYLDDNQLIDNAAELHDVRERRNSAGHEAFSQVSWDELDRDIERLNHTLEHLGFVGPLPSFRVVSERSAMQESGEPGVLGHQDYAVRVLEGDRTVGEFKWRQTLYDDAT